MAHLFIKKPQLTPPWQLPLPGMAPSQLSPPWLCTGTILGAFNMTDGSA